MSTFILVHARWHGAWCWERVAAPLRRAGHTVLTPDRAPFDDLHALVAAQPEPAVLVGHSSAGMTISALAALAPDRVRALVYVSAFLLPPGMTPPQVMAGDTESILADHLRVDLDRGLVTVTDPERVFFNACAPADAARAAARLLPEPLALPALPPTPPAGGTDRVYVVCEADRALGPATQRRMAARTPCREIHALPADHAPFLSTPEGLAGILRSVSDKTDQWR